jgi:CDP-glucose 4,6-dehydratase
VEDLVNALTDSYEGKRVLVTGHTGFKGAWLSLWLHSLGARVHGFALPSPGEPDLVSLLGAETFERQWLRDLREPGALQEAVTESEPDLVFHLAAQPLVGRSYRNPLDTFTTNAVGTALLLEALRAARSPACAVLVTSDKCYRNDQSGRAFAEDDPLGGADVYSMSKAAAELVAAAWHASFFAGADELGPLATARAGNVIGGGDYGEDRIVPDAVRAYLAGIPLVLRRPSATRPWQHVLECLAGYLVLGQRLLEGPRPTALLTYNFGPEPDAERSVQDLVEAWDAAWPGSVRPETGPRPAYAEATRLGLDHGKAVRELGWRPVWSFGETVERTAAWYRLRHESGADPTTLLRFSREQIADYAATAARHGLAWAASPVPVRPAMSPS